jgi:hypothetical protein
MTFDYNTLAARCPLGSERDVACPLCGPDRRDPRNRRRKVLRVWHPKPGLATYNCKRCGAHGRADGEGSGRAFRSFPAPILITLIAATASTDAGSGTKVSTLKVPWSSAISSYVVDSRLRRRSGFTHG